MKKLLLSLALVSLATAGIIGGTYAYLSDLKVLGATTENTFATGTVAIGEFNIANLNVTGLTPGKWAPTISNVGIQYTGSINGDLYVGATGTSGTDHEDYFADKLYLKILGHGSDTVIWEGYVNALSTGWKKIASDIPAGWQAYDLQFYLHESMDRSAVNTDTKILIYAVQTGGPIPSTVPYLTTP